MFRKKRFLISTFAIMILILTGCSKKYTYEFVTIKDSSNMLDASFTYPQFKDSKLSDLNDLLNLAKDDFKNTVAEYQAEWREWNEELAEESIAVPQFYYNENSQVSFSGNYISILQTTETYLGGAHGSTTYFSICFDAEKQEFVNLETVTGKTHEELVKYCKDDIIRQLYKDSPEDADIFLSGDLEFSAFTIDNGKVIIYFAPYEVASYAEGTVTVEIK